MTESSFPDDGVYNNHRNVRICFCYSFDYRVDQEMSIDLEANTDITVLPCIIIPDLATEPLEPASVPTAYVQLHCTHTVYTYLHEMA